MVEYYFDWNEEKNALLKIQRGIGFEDVVAAIEDGRLLDIMQHPNKGKYPGQDMFVVEINEYAYIVPFVEDEEKTFLKTLFPSRKATKRYIIDRRKKKKP